MLYLDRKPSQTIVIWTDAGLKITVEVVSIRGRIVKLGAEAPAGVHIDREEIYLRKTAEVPA